MRSRSDRPGTGGPQITISVSGRKKGAKKSSPWMWSRCRCVSRMWMRSTSAHDDPRSRIPLPASSTSTLPSDSVTSTHEVLPPYRAVCGPGAGIEPRAPQILTLTASTAPSSASSRPEEDQRPLEPRGSDQRDRAYDDLEVAAVGGPETLDVVPRPPVPDRQRERVLVERDVPPFLVERPELLTPLSHAHRARLLEADPGQLGHGLVVVDEGALEVDQAAGRVEAVEEAARKDQFDRLLLGGDRQPPFPDVTMKRGHQAVAAARSAYAVASSRVRVGDKWSRASGGCELTALARCSAGAPGRERRACRPPAGGSRPATAAASLLDRDGEDVQATGPV